MKPEAKHFANIGYGSGLTAETVLSHSGPRILDTIEIEPAMVVGACLSAARHAAVLDPRIISSSRTRRATCAARQALRT